MFFAVGTTLAPSPAVTNSPANQGQASSPPEPAFALGPVTVPTGTSEFPTQHLIMFSDHNQHLTVAPCIALFHLLHQHLPQRSQLLVLLLPLSREMPRVQ